MKVFVLIGLIFIFAGSLFLNRTSKFHFAPDHYILANCIILDSSGAIIRDFDQNVCIPLPDGSLIAHNGRNDLMKWDRAGKLEWSLPITPHHLLNLTKDGKSLLAIGSEDFKVEGKTLRLDNFYEISLDGKILKKWLSRDHLRQLLKIQNRSLSNLQLDRPTWLEKSKADTEITHANSIDQIGDNDFSRGNAAFSPGNIIISLHDGIIILDKNMNEIVWNSGKRIVHDVSFQKNGILIFNNGQANADPRMSMPELLNPLTDTEAAVTPIHKESTYYSYLYGSVQPLPKNHYLVSFNDLDSTDGRTAAGKIGMAIINGFGRVEWSKSKRHESQLSGKKTFPILSRAQYLNLGEFLRNNQY